MTDAILRREIKRLVEEQKVLNQRLQRKPPRENRGGPLGPRPTADGDNKDAAASAPGGNAAEAGGPDKRPQGAGGGPPYNFEGPEFQVAKRPKIEVDANSAKRNKRMFGFLSSHLNKAKQQLTKEQDTDFAQRHKLQEERVNSKLELARKHIAEIARIQWQEQRKEDESQLAKVSQELVEKENDLMQHQVVGLPLLVVIAPLHALSIFVSLINTLTAPAVAAAVAAAVAVAVAAAVAPLVAALSPGAALHQHGALRRHRRNGTFTPGGCSNKHASGFRSACTCCCCCGFYFSCCCFCCLFLLLLVLLLLLLLQQLLLQHLFLVLLLPSIIVITAVAVVLLRWRATKIKHIQEADFAFNAGGDGENDEEPDDAGEAADPPEDKEDVVSDAESSKAEES
ncbi:hypothetical protein ACSSS7_000444 [Eimeria intestinalis]